MALPALAPEDEEEVAGAGPGVAPLAPVSAPPGMPQMPGVPPAAPAPPGPGLDPNAPPPGAVPPDPNADLPPDALMQPGADLQPPAPTAPPPIPLTPDGKVDIAAAEKNALGEQGQLQAQGEGAERAKGAAETKIADAESTAADKQAAEAAQHAIDQQKVVDTANANTQKWLDQAQQDAQKYRGMGLHDYWQDKSTGDKVLAGLSMLFGAAGKTQGGPENNPGMGMIERAVERDFRRQQADIEKARSNLAVDKEQVDLGMTAKQQALADSNLKKANAYDAAAAQLVSYKLKQGVPLAQANTDANVVALRQKGLAARQETLTAIHAQNVADAHLDIEKERADAYRAKMTRGKGGAGAGGQDRAAVAWTQWAEQNPNASETDKKAKAAALGIPLNAKAGHTSYETLTKDLATATKGDEAIQARVIRDANNAPKGLVPTGKSVQQFQKDTINNAAAIRALEDLEKSGDRIPTGSKWNNAVGAVASTTTMGKSNESIHVEGNQLKGFGGMVINHAAVKAKIEELKKRQDELNASLEPLPPSFKSRTGPAAAAAPAGPQSDRDLARSIKSKTGGAAAAYPVGTRAKTKDGKPVVMTANGWTPA